MGNILPFRRLWWGSPRKLSTPYFLRPSLFRRLRPFLGYAVIAVAIAAAAYLAAYWNAVDTGSIVIVQ